jgi:hypothetical protein
MSERAKEILANMKALQDELKVLEKVEEGILPGTRKLEEISPEKKIEAFDKLYGQMHKHVLTTVREGWRPKDGHHYIFESVMDLTLGEVAYELMSNAGG